MGRPPKPTKLKILEGNPGRRPLNTNEPQPTPDIPTRPEWLNAEAKREWGRVVPELHRLGLLTVVDRGALARYCQAWGRMVQAEKAIDEKGSTFETANGYPQIRPEVTIAQKYSALCARICVEFGFTPSARGRLTIPGQKEEDPFEKFLAGGNKN
jgi:P27 family predicted phage terminase small subunit